MKNYLQYLLLGMLGLFGLSINALAAVPTAISDVVTDATTLFGTVETFIVAVVAFMVLIGIVKLVRRAR